MLGPPVIKQNRQRSCLLEASILNEEYSCLLLLLFFKIQYSTNIYCLSTVYRNSAKAKENGMIRTIIANP